jgi:hypothetical protein
MSLTTLLYLSPIHHDLAPTSPLAPHEPALGNAACSPEALHSQAETMALSG